MSRLVSAVALFALVGVAACRPSPTDAEVQRVDLLSVPDSVRTAYAEDAARLAARELGRSGAAEDQAVELPEALVEGLLEALLRVYAATDLPARDSVVAVRPIHTFPNPPLHDLMVSVEKGTAWADAWRAGTVRTGNPAVDALVDRHGLVLHAFHAWSIGETAVLRAPAPLNLAGLAKRFRGVAGVRFADPDGAVGDGDDIRAQRDGAGWRLDYSAGEGDCPSGCIERTTWSFGVAEDGQVSYLGRSAPERGE